jgi:hypothetical protein
MIQGGSRRSHNSSALRPHPHSQELTQVIWGLSRLSFRPNDRFLDAAAAAVERMTSSSDPFPSSPSSPPPGVAVEDQGAGAGRRERAGAVLSLQDATLLRDSFIK